MLHFHLITLFPDAMRAYLDESMLGRAQQSKKIKISYYNPRDFTNDKHRRVDHKPYGGGPGMVMAAEPVLRAAKKAIGRKKGVHTIFLAPDGKQFTSATARRCAQQFRHIVIIAGHYEGIDERVCKILKASRVSLGPFTLTGGEIPAMAIVDATARFVPGVLGNEGSLEESRTASPAVYTRPEVLAWGGKRHRVPGVLLSGHHREIEAWKRERGERA